MYAARGRSDEKDEVNELKKHKAEESQIKTRSATAQGRGAVFSSYRQKRITIQCSPGETSWAFRMVQKVLRVLCC